MGMSFDPLGFVGNIFDTVFNSAAADRRTQQQRDDAMFFAQNRLQMTVQDGAKAGLSPLASIGASANLMPATLAGAPTSSMGQSSMRLTQEDKDPLDEKIKNAQLHLLESQAADHKADAVAKTVVSSRAAVENQPANVNVPLPRARSDVLKPLYQDYDDGRGGVVTSLTEPASQSFQNWASLPAQIAAAAGLAGRNIEHFTRWAQEPGRSWNRESRRRMAKPPDSKFYSPF